MAQMSVNNLTFCYEGSFDPVFEGVSFMVDTNWKLGFLGRNGKGKTTFLKLILGKYEYSGSISCNTVCDYFPYDIKSEYMQLPASSFLDTLKPGCEDWKVLRELDKLDIDAEVLYRPFQTLSFGERTKVMLAVLFSEENDFLLIDEPTNHLDQRAREIVKHYLSGKKGYILVSHDRDLLDACIDHVLVLNRRSIEVQAGNFSSWWENKSRKDAFAMAENEKHQREINKLKSAAEQTRKWADKNEQTKIGFDPEKEPDRCIGTRSYIAAKTKKMQSRVKLLETRLNHEIEEKEGLLCDIERPTDLRITPLQHYKDILIRANAYGLQYPDAAFPLFTDLSFTLQQGERVFLHGANGCGKSSLIHAIRAHAGYAGGIASVMQETGTLQIASGLVISYINQDTSWLSGSIREFCSKKGLEESLFCAVLRQLDLEREQFAKDMKEFSEGQKKKVLIAASLLTPAHLYIWDEPLNYIDVFSRMQIERLLLAAKPTMLIVEHDVRFMEQVATKVVEFKSHI